MEPGRLVLWVLAALAAVIGVFATVYIDENLRHGTEIQELRGRIIKLETQHEPPLEVHEHGQR